MYRVFALFISVLLPAISLVNPIALADHPPGKMMRNFKAFSQLGETGQLGPFKVNVARFGSLPDQTITSRPRGFAEFLDDNLNLASIVMRNGDIIHEAYNSQRNINSNTPLLGMSMSKTAISASVGSLICEGRIKHLDDRLGVYSSFLKETAFADVTVRNVLQMNSGVSPLGRADEKKFNRKARGIEEFDGQASVREALRLYESASRPQGETMNYHSTDTLALSVLVEEVSGMPASHYFHEKVYSAFGKSGYMHWTSDESGTTVAFSDLVMTARDWAGFGDYLMTQMENETCLGAFFKEGIENAVSTSKKNGSRYGYQSWVFDVNGQPSLVLQGHGGQFIVIDEANQTLLLTISINEKYEAGNLFSEIHKFAERISSDIRKSDIAVSSNEAQKKCGSDQALEVGSINFDSVSTEFYGLADFDDFVKFRASITDECNSQFGNGKLNFGLMFDFNGLGAKQRNEVKNYRIAVKAEDLDFVTDLNVLRECQKTAYWEDDGQIKEVNIQMKHVEDNTCLFEKLPVEAANILQRLAVNMESIVRQAQFKDQEWNARIDSLTKAFH